MSMQKAVKKPSQPSHTAEILLSELGQACETVLKLLHQLEAPGITSVQKEEILGELSAEITHLHEHTRGLDNRVLEDGS